MQLIFLVFWYLSYLSSLLLLIFPFAFVLLLPMLLSTPDAKPSAAKLAATKKSRGINIAALTRKPEFIENLFIYLERRNLFQCVSISVRVLPLTLTNELAYAALRKLVLKYPLLALFPLGEGLALRWQPLSEIRFSDVFEVDENVDVGFTDPGAKTELLTQMSAVRRHQQKIPLWRFVYYKKTGWLTFQGGHSFTDGASVVAYLKDYVELLNNVDAEEFEDVLYDSQKDMALLECGIPPRFFDHVQFKPDYFTKFLIWALKSGAWFVPTMMSTIFETTAQNLCFVDRPPVPFLARSFFEAPFVISTQSPLNSAIPRFINLTNEEVGKILVDCRVHGVKLLTYVLFVYLQTVHQVCPGTYTQKFLKASVAANLRNRYPIFQSHNKYLGNIGKFEDGFYSSIVSYFIEPGTMFSWEVLRKYHDFLHNSMYGTEWFKQYYVASEVLTPESYMGPRVDTKKDDCFLFLTNLGNIDVLEHSPSSKFQIEDILFSPSIGTNLGTHHIALCSTAKSGLRIGFTDGDKNVKDWENFGLKLKENFLQLLQTN